MNELTRFNKQKLMKYLIFNNSNIYFHNAKQILFHRNNKSQSSFNY